MKTLSSEEPQIATPQVFQRRLKFLLGFLVFINLFFFRAGGPVAFALAVAGFIVFLLGSLASDRSKLNITTVAGFLGAESVLLGSMIMWANHSVSAVGVISVILSLFLFAYCLARQLPFVRGFSELIISPALFIFYWVIAGFRTLGCLFIPGDRQMIFKSLDGLFGSKKISSLIIGTAVGIPVAGIIGFLLTQADPIFASLTKNIFSREFFLRLPIRVFLTFQIWSVLFPFLLLKPYSLPNPFGMLKRRSWTTEAGIVLGLVGLILGIFLVIQWPYVFAHVNFETDLSKFGVATYSEYVRKGFQELLVIAALIYSLVWAGLLALRTKKEEDKSMLPIIQGVVLGELILFIVSIFRRIWLYQTYHGWSLIRVYGGFFLLWVFVMVTILALRHVIKSRWVIAEALATAIIIGLFVWTPTEKFFILNHPPTVNKRVDYVYLSRLSPDGYDGWTKAYAWAEAVTSQNNQRTGTILKDQRRDIAYAGSITEQLTRKYQSLLISYGTDAEKRDYIKTVFGFQIQQNTILTQSLENEDRELALLGKNLRNVDSYKQSILDRTRASQLWMQDTLKKIDKPETDIDETLSHIAFQYSFSSPASGDYFYGSMSLEKNSLYRIDTYGYGMTHYNGLERLFLWNASRITAYHQMQKDMPISRMIALQNAFLLLYQRIAGQPEEERKYEADISFSMPFVESY